MKRLLALVGLTLLIAGSATAQIDPDPNQIGVYFDPLATEFCTSAAMYMAVSAHVMFTNPTDPTGTPCGISGWEAEVTAIPPATGGMINGATLMGSGPINLFAYPTFQVGMGTPWPPAPVIHVADINIFTLNTDAWFFTIGAIGPTSWPEDPGPGFAVDYDPGILVRVMPSSGSMDLPVAQVNGVCGVTAAQDDTWGGVKSMFK